MNERERKRQASGGLSRAVEAGLGGEALSARGLLDAIGGVRGIVEALLPALVFLAVYVFTEDARVSAIAPVVISVLATGSRLVQRQSISGALSGLVGVAVCALAVLFTGEGRSFFLPGFWINGAWIVAHTVSLIVGWPLLGLLLGYFRGSLTEWRRVPMLRHAAALCTVAWIAVFAARLAVQLPLYFAAGTALDTGSSATAVNGAVEALGIARLVMGVPLFAIAILFTWLVLSRVSARIPSPDRESEDLQSSDE